MKKDKCPNCGDNQNLNLIKNIGYNVDGDGEEHQHMQKCECGYYRFVIDVYPFDKNFYRHFGPWKLKNKD